MVKSRFFGVLKCRYCSSRMVVSVESYKENPYCSECLPERLMKAASEDPVIGLRELGNGYVLTVRLSDVQRNQ